MNGISKLFGSLKLPSLAGKILKRERGAAYFLGSSQDQYFQQILCSHIPKTANNLLRKKWNMCFRAHSTLRKFN